MTDAKVESYTKGDRVRHPTQAAWGLGQVLEDSAGGSVRLFFEGAGERTLGLAYVQPVRVTGEAAQSTLLDNLLIKAQMEGSKFKSLPESVQYFLTEFPGGFEGERLHRNERDYKVKAHEQAKVQLAHDVLRALLNAQQWEDICTRALKLVNATNLVFPNEKMQLKDALKPEVNQAKFAEALVGLLHGKDVYRDRFLRFANVLEEIDAAKWTTATYFPYIVFPEEHMFLKPTVTQEAAELCGFEISYQSTLNWNTYDRLLVFSRWLFDELTERGLKPRDMIDVQSFIWCIAPRQH